MIPPPAARRSARATYLAAKGTEAEADAWLAYLAEVSGLTWTKIDTRPDASAAESPPVSEPHGSDAP